MSRDPPPHAFALREELDTALARRAGYDAWSPRLKAALEDHQRTQMFAQLRFLVLMGLLISAVAFIFDALVVPEKIQLSLGWRLATTVPLSLAALMLFDARQLGWIKLLASASLVCFGMLAMHLASFAAPEAMARYTLATSFTLGLACLAMPLTPTELKRFALSFALATSIAGLWPNPLPRGEMALHLAFTLLLGTAAWMIAQRHWNLKARAFLLDLRDDFTRQELEQGNELLRQLSEQDPLTGMPNRRLFERVCSEGLAAQGRDASDGRLALMMIDLDHFKAFNDRHGHQAGDRCLAMAGAQLQEVFGTRRGIVARYGGEEFVAALQESAPGEAEALADEMRARIAAMLVPVREDSAPLITTSIGLALAPADTALELEDLIEMADVALYSAKRAGRNRVEKVEAGDLPLREKAGGERRRIAQRA